MPQATECLKEATRAAQVPARLRQLKKLFPDVRVIEYCYHGCGDQPDMTGIEQVEMRDGTLAPYEIINAITSVAEDFLFSVVEMGGADFNNDGCEGSARFDLDELTATISNGSRYTALHHSTTAIASDGTAHRTEEED